MPNNRAVSSAFSKFDEEAKQMDLVVNENKTVIKQTVVRFTAWLPCHCWQTSLPDDGSMSCTVDEDINSVWKD